MKRSTTRSSVLLVATAALPLLLGVDLFQRHNRAVEDGNARMKAGKAEEALTEYDKAVAKLPHDPGAHFARGTALYSLSRWDDAANEFLHATEAKTPDLKASAFYNLGNSFFQGQKYGESVEAFKKSLAYNPGNLRAKWNLELALRKKKEDDQKKKDDQKKNPNGKDDKKNKDQSDKGKEGKDDKQAKDDKKDQSDKGKDNDKDDKKDKPGDNGQAQNQPQPDKQGEEEKKQQEQAKQDENKPPEPQPQPGDKQNPKQAQGEAQKGEPGKDQPPVDPHEIEGILDNLERSPKTLEQELARARAVNRRPPVKDW